jgi:hypothetical protein
MDIIGYRLLQEVTESNQKVNNVMFKDKDWIKWSIIQQLQEIDTVEDLETKVKCLITDIITVDMLDPNTILIFVVLLLVCHFLY